MHIDKDITPVQQPITRVPFHTKQAITAELECLLKLDIIERATGPTNWVNPIVPVSKNDNTIRLCLDMHRAITAIIREVYVNPKLEDNLTELHKDAVFSTLGSREIYYQILLHIDTCFPNTFGYFQIQVTDIRNQLII